MNQAEAIAAAQKLGPEWKWVAMDSEHAWFAFTSKPFADYDGGWFSCEPNYSFKRLTEWNEQYAWRETAVEVPQ